jgi:AAA family ATP:ADP antiporter
MLAAAVILVFCAALTVLSDRRDAARDGAAKAKASQKPLASGDGFAMIFKDRYLVLIAFLVLLLNVVNTSGEFILSNFVIEQAKTIVGASAEHSEARDRFIGAFYGDYFFWVNLLVLILQTFFVARIYRYIGVGGSLFILPVLAFSGYSLLLVAPVLGTIRILKILENSTDYSVQNTTRQALFLPTSREAKYKAKAAIDTFFQRAGDVIQAGIVYVGTNVFSLGVAGFAGLNLTLTLVWLGVVTALFFEYRRRTAASQAASDSQPTA